MSNSSLYNPTPDTGTVSSTNLTTLYSNTNNFITGVVNSSVYSVNAGAGITVNPTTGNVVVSNTGVLSVIAGTNISVSGSTGNVTINATDTNTTYQIASATVSGGANLNLVGSDSTTDSVKFASGSGITVSSTDANTITITNTNPAGTTYAIDASTTSGGANFNLTGSDSSTDTIKFAGGTNVTVTATDANTITIAAPDTNTTYTIQADTTTGGANLTLVGSDSSTDSVKIANGTGVTVSRTDASTINVAIGQDVATTANVSFLTANITNSATLGNGNTDNQYVHGRFQHYGGNILSAANQIVAQTRASYLTTSTTAANQTIYSVDSSGASGRVFYGGKFVILVTSGTDYHITEMLVLVDTVSGNTWNTQYAELFSTAPLATFNVTVTGTNTWDLRATPVNAVTNIRVQGTLMAK